MAIATSLTESQVLAALKNFIIEVLGINKDAIVRAQNNRVPEPAFSDFVVMTPMLRNRISTNVDTQVDANTASAMQATQITVQLDIHGPASADNAQLISTLLRDGYGTRQFASQTTGYDVTPLYADDPRQMPFVNAEQQYELRWVINAVLQANPVLSYPQDSAAEVHVTPRPPADAFRGVS